MNPLASTLSLAALCVATAAQSTAIFPANYATVAEGPLNSGNLPLAYGVSRVQIVYEAVDLTIPSGNVISQLGFRQDDTLTTMDAGRSLQLEVRMGWTTATAATLASNFDNNYAAPPTTVFGPALFTLPNLRDAANPLPNGQFFITLTTPFPYVPNGNNLVVEYRVQGTSAGGAAFSYRLDRADFVSPVTQGPAGCPHSTSQTPSLATSGLRPGQTLQMSLTRGPANSFALLLVSPGNTLVSPFSLQPFAGGISPSCTGQVPLAGLITLSGLTSGSGSRSWSWSIPNNAAWNGFPWAAQAAILDFFSPGGVVVSNGVDVVLGTPPRTSILYASGPPANVTSGSVSRNYAPVAFFVHQ